MNPTPEPGHEVDLDASTVEAVLSGARPSGDPALDGALDALRALVTAAPESDTELARLLGPVAVLAAADELGRRRQGGARHVATGTTVIAGVLLATATAAAAMGGLGTGPRSAPPPAAPTVLSRTAPTPHHVEPAPTRLPVLPASSPDTTHKLSDPAVASHREKAANAGPGTPTASARHTEDSEDSRASDDPGESQVGDHEAQSQPSTGRSTEPTDGDGDSSGPGSGDGAGDPSGAGDLSGGGHSE
jgi:hypothetical protein